VKISNVEHPVDTDVKLPINTQSFSHHHKTKLKCQKPVVMVVRDMLIKK
jgi:hypothetical protein